MTNDRMLRQPAPSTDRRAGRDRRALLAWTALAGLLLLAMLAAPCLVGYVYTHDDLGAFHLPLRAFYVRQLARGEPFDWMPHLFAGFYLTGEGQAGTYHPLHLLLYRLLPLPAAMACELLASYPFMLAGTYLLLRRHRIRAEAALFGSLVFTFSGFNLLHFAHPNAVAVVAHIPWLLWAIHVTLAGSRRSQDHRRQVVAAQAGIALLTGSQLLLGYPQYVWFSLLTEVAYACFLMTGRRYAGRRAAASGARNPGGIRASLRPCWRLLLAKGIGVMLGGIQLLPTFDALGHSVRRSADAAFVNSGSMHPLNLVQLVAPYLFAHRVVGQNTHELGLYLGAVPLVLIVWLLAQRRALGRLRRPALAAGAFGIFALVLAFGKYGQVYRLQRLLPLVGGFRFPCRYVVLFHLGMAVLSAIALLMLARQRQRKQKTSWRELGPLAAVVAASALAAAVGLFSQASPLVAPPAAVLAGPLLVGLAAVLVVLAARGVRGALVGLVLLAAADLGYYGMSYAVYPHAERLETYAARTKTPPGTPQGRVLADVVRFDQSGLQTGNQMTLAGWRRADGYAALVPRRQLDYRRLAALRAAGVGWVRRSRATAAIDGLLPHDECWYRVPNPLRHVRLVTQARTSRDPAGDIARIPLESAALVEAPLDLPAGSPGTVALVDERPGWLRVRVDCPSRQLLVVSESYHSGWRAEVDGRPQSVLRANGDFLGCVVPEGRHEVVLQFRPRSLHRGLLVSCLGLALAAASAIGYFAKWRFSRAEKSAS